MRYIESTPVEILWYCAFVLLILLLISTGQSACDTIEYAHGVTEHPQADDLRTVAGFDRHC